VPFLLMVTLLLTVTLFVVVCALPADDELTVLRVTLFVVFALPADDDLYY
jgi:hypothetical protein